MEALVAPAGIGALHARSDANAAPVVAGARRARIGVERTAPPA
jgi:hypothetical protein